MDTGFLIRLLKRDDPLHNNARGYYDYFLRERIVLKCSAVAIGECCVKGSLDDLPLRQMQVVPYNLHHAVRAGAFARELYARRKTEKLPERPVIINDVKMFAQAAVDPDVEAFVTSDPSAKAMHDALVSAQGLAIKFININTPYDAYFTLQQELFRDSGEEPE